MEDSDGDGDSDDALDSLTCCWLGAVARRLERNIKDVLDKIGDDKQRLQQLLTGKRVLLAEELSELVSVSLTVYTTCLDRWLKY